MIDWYNISENDDEDDVDELDSAEEQVVPKSNAKYQYYDQNDFPASPDDTAHVFLADLCHRIHAPLYAYDEILQWGQEAYLSGYHFSTNVPM